MCRSVRVVRSVFWPMLFATLMAVLVGVYHDVVQVSKGIDSVHWSVPAAKTGVFADVSNPLPYRKKLNGFHSWLTTKECPLLLT